MRPLEFGPLPRQLVQHLLQILRHDLVLPLELPPQQVVQNLYHFSCSLLVLQVVMGQSIQMLPEEVPFNLKYVLLGLNSLLHILRQFETKVVQKLDVLFVQASPLFNFNCASNQLWKFQVFCEDVVFPASLTNFFVWVLQTVLVVPTLATLALYLLLLLDRTTWAPEERSIRVVSIADQVICTPSYIFRTKSGKKARVSLLARQKGQQTPLIFIQHTRCCYRPITVTF